MLKKSNIMTIRVCTGVSNYKDELGHVSVKETANNYSSNVRKFFFIVKQTKRQFLLKHKYFGPVLPNQYNTPFNSYRFGNFNTSRPFTFISRILSSAKLR